MDRAGDEKRVERRRPRGVGCRFFGSILIFTGLLNSMVALKAELSGSTIDYALLISGAALMVFGSIRK